MKTTGGWLAVGDALVSGALMVLAVAVLSVQAFGQERFRSIDFTNSAFVVQYQGTNQQTATFTNGSAALLVGSNNAAFPNNWFNVGDWYNTPVTLTAGVYVPGGTNQAGVCVFQLNGAYDAGGNANQGPGPQAGVNPGPMLTVSNILSLTNAVAIGITNWASLTLPIGWFTNYHYLQWGQFYCAQTNGVITNSAGVDTNGVRVIRFRANWFR